MNLAATVNALQWVLGNTPAVEFLGTIEEYVAAAEKERDDARAAEAAARAALEKAQADAAAMAAKLNSIVADLADGVFDGPMPLDPVIPVLEDAAVAAV
jgi:hypothetical protein